MKVIVICGSVGSGKTEISKRVSKNFENSKVFHLNDFTKNYSIGFDEKLNTYDFDLDKCLSEFEKKHLRKKENDYDVLIIESHFSHFLNPKFVDLYIILNRDLKDLKKEYLKREYSKEKIKQNLECESFNIVFIEAKELKISDKKIKLIRNKNLEKTIKKVCDLIRFIN